MLQWHDRSHIESWLGFSESLKTVIQVFLPLLMVHSITACRAMSAEPQMIVLKERDSLLLCYCTLLCFQVAFLQCALNLGVIKAFCWSEFCSLSFIKPGTDHPCMPTTLFFFPALSVNRVSAVPCYRKATAPLGLSHHVTEAGKCTSCHLMMGD